MMVTLSDNVDDLGTMADAYGEFYWPDDVKEFIKQLKASELVKHYSYSDSKDFRDGFRAGFTYMRKKIDKLAGEKLI